ncbi:hypothetical protein H9P43_001825 [Blastocladiella emersonii ATCC 22665]|nr:hypothetical protein H9P43_001825 [Blastocladiella emersonii ATCC 22665]
MMQSDEISITVFDLPVDVQERVAAHLELRDACALRQTSRAALASSLWQGKTWWPAVFALVGGDTDKFRAAIPAYLGRLKGARAAKKREKKKQLFFELARALVRANVGEGKSWAALRNWAGGELPIDAAGYFAIIRAGLHVEHELDYNDICAGGEEDGDADDRDEEDGDEDDDDSDNDSSSAKPAHREPPTPPASKDAIDALAVVLQWKTRKGGLLYASYAEQTKTSFESQLPPIAPVLASPLIPSPVRRDLLRAHCGAKFYDEEPGKLVPAMLLEGPLFCLEILCLSVHQLQDNYRAIASRIESFLEQLMACSFGSEEHFETMRIVHDIFVAATDDEFCHIAPPQDSPVRVLKQGDTRAAFNRLIARVDQIRREKRAPGEPDDEYDDSIACHLDIDEILHGVSLLKYDPVLTRAHFYAVMHRPPRTSDAIRAWANELRYWEPSLSLWTVNVTMLRNTGVAEVADEAEKLLPITTQGEPFLLMFRVGSELVLRTRPFKSVADLRKAYDAVDWVPRESDFL